MKSYHKRSNPCTICRSIHQFDKLVVFINLTNQLYFLQRLIVKFCRSIHQFDKLVVFTILSNQLYFLQKLIVKILQENSSICLISDIYYFVIFEVLTGHPFSRTSIKPTGSFFIFVRLTTPKNLLNFLKTLFNYLGLV